MSDLRKVVEIAWRRHLSSESGLEGMNYLRSATPGVSRGDQYQMIFDAGVSEGYKQALNRIADISPVEPIPEKSLENL